MKVKDPVCGMVFEDTHAAGRLTLGTETVYFCSTACQKTYERKHLRRPS